MRKIAVANQKGGVGKTTVAVNLGVALGLLKEKVLLIDLDPQQNASSHLGVQTNIGIEDLFLSNKTLDDIIYKSNEIDIDYDFVIVDCPSHLGVLTINALTYCDELLIPVKCDYLALEGLSKILDTVGTIKKSLNPGLKITGIVPTFFDVRTSISRYVFRELKKNLRNQITTIVIRINTVLAEAPAYSKDIFNYNPRSRGAVDFEYLGKEIIRRAE
jgi:chromosome partitioning protein